jgi:hypothetical protein
MVSVHYPKLDFVNIDQTTNLDIVTYRDGLLEYLRRFRGIKQEYLPWYCQFYNLTRQKNQDELRALMIAQLHTYKKSG